ncbi:MAG: NADH-quinone oxidoreductase subunit NuoF, partial [Nitrospirota bacterium]
GYKGLSKALSSHKPQELIDMVKRSGLRGRGGAGFPTGVKWDFIPKDPNLTKYLCCNADEGEPGTFKDRELMEKDPHQMIEGIAISSYAIGAKRAYIYIRGELVRAANILSNAISEAYKKGYLGNNILGSGFSLDIYVHRGAGAYICGEETALIESLEGKRGQPRLKPPFPATYGLYGKPTVVNNVETISNIPHIVLKGDAWYSQIGTQKSTGTRIFSVSGHVKKPGNYELPLGTPLREIIENHAGGLREGRKLKAIIPGGSSTPILTPDHIDIPMDFESVASAGSALGSGGLIIMDDTTCMVHVAKRLMEFYYHESCGKCTPCRIGTKRMLEMLEDLSEGRGKDEYRQLFEVLTIDLVDASICGLGQSAPNPVASLIRHFNKEFKEHLAGKCKLGVCKIKGRKGRKGIKEARAVL